jgi:hypothetical protein
MLSPLGEEVVALLAALPLNWQEDVLLFVHTLDSTLPSNQSPESVPGERDRGIDFLILIWYIVYSLSLSSLGGLGAAGILKTEEQYR